MSRKPADPEEELRWMAQEVRGYVEAVLNSLAANVPKAVVLCQVEKAKEDMLNKLYSSISSQSLAFLPESLLSRRAILRIVLAPTIIKQQQPTFKAPLNFPASYKTIVTWNKKSNKLKVCCSQVKVEDYGNINDNEEACELVNGTEITIGDEGVRA
ncbi:hypothetical protein CASFOL_039582 [Castilleja foliolosa]|uniref:Dynamin GTPase effector domain-containing protein n=1 Tax=Castilleja foliolosa TaxID=1961234 RepID=A0ABD3BG02_9LAMI